MRQILTKKLYVQFVLDTACKEGDTAASSLNRLALAHGAVNINWFRAAAVALEKRHQPPHF